MILISLCLILVLSLPQLSSAITFEETVKVQNKCLNESNLDTMFFLNILLTGDNMNDTNFKKFVDCIYKEHGFIQQSNYTINTELVRQYNMLFHAEKDIDAFTKGCEKIAPDTKDIALEHYKCLAMNKKALSKKVQPNKNSI